jgi:hypothetical protein
MNTTLDKEYAQWLAKRLINEVPGWEKKTKLKITTVHPKVANAVFFSWYKKYITKTIAFEYLTELAKDKENV